MATHSVNVSGIAPQTSTAELQNFFTFCGKITRIDHEKATATVHFEKPSAAKTALMLNGGVLDGASLTITSDVEHEDQPEDPTAPYEQSDKPRAGIAAEYLAKGYMLHDHILQRAIDIDNQRGISKRFLNYLSSIDTSLGSRLLGENQTVSGKAQEQVNYATAQAKAIDEKGGYLKTASDYYSKALASPLGQKVFAFYTTTSKQVLDIHEEAKRIQEQHKAAAGGSSDTTSTPAPAAPAGAAPVST